MANIFKLTKDYVNPPKRNSYDLSYQNDFTAKFGTLYPIFIKEVNPGDSFSINTALGIRAEPMVFPVQSKIRADVHYFYVRNRTLWENWMNFIGKVDDTIEHPYIVQSNNFFKSKTLADFLGVPTSIVGGVNTGIYYQANPFTINGGVFYPQTQTQQVTFKPITKPNISDSFFTLDRFELVPSSDFTGPYVPSLPLADLFNNSQLPRPLFSYLSRQGSGKCVITPVVAIDDIISSLESVINAINNSGSFDDRILMSYYNTIGAINTSQSVVFLRAFFGNNNTEIVDYREITNTKFSIRYSIPSSLDRINYYYDSTYIDSAIQLLSFAKEAKIYGYSNLIILISDGAGFLSDTSVRYNDEGYKSFGNVFSLPNASRSLSYDSSDSQLLPWVTYSSSNIAPIKLSALPFRAYEAIYNSYYRNYMNNPFMLNGKPQYNRYVTNLGDGADTTPYKLFNRNWELDFLTSAQQSPQQGEAPLVGITVNPNSTATMKFKSAELESAGVANGEVTATVEIDENTNILGISYYDEQLPQSNLKRLMEAINYGISINDLRQTTALQRWLEKNIMKGYRYIDQVKAHFGVDVSYRDLLMPEFIGGHSQTINTLTISQTTPTGDSPLGSYGGQAISNSSSENTVTKYCDEAGFIVGIMSIVPTPVYSQVPQQFFYKSNVLDYYFPEFGSIGMQPIFNKDITPLQTDRNKLDDVFGYQRPWWHLISSIDEVHGEFRTNRQGYLIQRMFEETPVLNGDFLTINNDVINNVFYVDDEQSDQFLCQAYFKVTKKTAIPLFGVPAIENADVN